MAEPPKTPIHRLRFPGTLAGFEEASRSLRQFLEAHRLSEDTRFHIELVFEEIAVNIIRHGKPRADVNVEVTVNGEVVLTFEDDGQSFDPRDQPLPAPPESIEETRVGGLGLVLVKQFCTRLEYERTAEDRNRLTVSIPVR